MIFIDQQGLFDGSGLAEAGFKIAACESCTGGAVAEMLCKKEGSSGWFAGGLVVYSAHAKSKLAGVDPALIEAKGVYCEEVAIQMAMGAAEAFECRYAVSTTGLAGPGGCQTPDGRVLPQGFVCFGFCDKESGRLESRSAVFFGSRAQVRLQAAEWTLCWLDSMLGLCAK